MSLTFVQPVPWREDYGPAYTRQRGDKNYDFAWKAPDAQGMHPRPPGYHSAVDMFAPGNSPVRAPFDGRVTRSERGGGVIGQVFGGVLCIEHAEGYAVLMRHVNPVVGVGALVEAGQHVAAVTDWLSGSPHAHVECYRFWPASYDHSNTIDPRLIEWTILPPAQVAPVAVRYVEDMPHNKGGTGPVVVRRTPSKAAQLASVAKQKSLGRIVTTMRDSLTGDYCVLWWLPGTHAAGLPVFGPWADQAAQEHVAKQREQRRGKAVRLFSHRQNSLYPLPG